jgi:hypothetical protein
VAISDGQAAEGKPAKATVKLKLGGLDYNLEPLKTDENKELKDPPGSGGLMMALYQYRRLLAEGAKGFEADFSHGGHEPFYPMPADGNRPKSLAELRVDAEVIRTEHGAVPAKWYFSRKDQTLLGFEMSLDKEEDPCEVYLSDYKPVDGRMLPHRLIVWHRDEHYGTFTVKNYKLNASK